MFEHLFSRAGLSLERLRTLAEVFEAGSIAKAAAADPTRQSLYSRQIKELETFFGRELTRRQGRNLVLTPQGEAAAATARASLMALEDLYQDLASQPLTYVIGGGDALIQWLLLPRLPALWNDLPGIRFAVRNLRGRDVLSGLQDRRIDFGILRRDTLPGNLAHLPLGMLRYALFVPDPLMPETNPSPTAVLRHVPLAALHTDAAIGLDIRQALAGNGNPPEFALVCESFPELLQAVKSGRCAAVLPTLCQAALPDGEFHQFPIPALRRLAGKILLAWNPRVIHARPSADRCQAVLARHLAFK